MKRISNPLPDGSQHRPPLSVSREEAARMLGVSVDFFDEHIRPRLRIVYSGRRILVPVAELERWLGTNAASTTRRRAA